MFGRRRKANPTGISQCETCSHLSVQGDERYWDSRCQNCVMGRKRLVGLATEFQPMVDRLNPTCPGLVQEDVGGMTVSFHCSNDVRHAGPCSGPVKATKLPEGG